MALIKCPECGKEVSDKAISCPNCGCPIASSDNLKANVAPTETPQAETTPTETTPTEQPKQNKKGKGCGYGCLVAIALYIVISAVCVVIGLTNPKGNKNLKAMNLTMAQETAMLQIFQDCGIGEITSVQPFQSGETKSSYYLADNEVNNIVVWVNNEDKTVDSIYYNDNDIYLNGAVVSQITNFYVNSEDKSNYRVQSQMAVQKLLKYPDTAEFPAISGWKFGINNGSVIVQSTVTAKNAFGVESTNNFQVTFTNHSITSLILDGTEYINK